jgi:ABC-type uncharacterized transport system ATPase subunit
VEKESNDEYRDKHNDLIHTVPKPVIVAVASLSLETPKSHLKKVLGANGNNTNLFLHTYNLGVQLLSNCM